MAGQGTGSGGGPGPAAGVHGSTGPQMPSGWTLFENKHTGTSLIVRGRGATPTKGILNALGASTPAALQSWRWAGSFTDGLDAAIGNFGLAINQIPSGFTPAKGKAFMPLSGNINNSPFNTGSPLSPQITPSQAQGFDTTVNNLPSTLSGIFNQAIKDLKYGLVLVAAVGAAIYLFVHGLTGAAKPKDQARVIIATAKKARA